MSIKNKLAGIVMIAALVLPGLSFAQSMSNADLQSQIAGLMAQLQTLENQLQSQGGSTVATPWCYTFSTNLFIGMTGSAVTELQTALQKDGESVTVNGTFDDQTASAVSGFQQKYASVILTPNGLQYGTGYVGKATRAELNSLFGCGTTTPPSTYTVSPSSGPAGTVITLSPSFTNCGNDIPLGQCTTDRFNDYQLLQNGSVVADGIEVVAASSIESTSMQLQIPTSMAAGTYELAVQNCLGKGCATTQLGVFTVTSIVTTSAPYISGMTPGDGPIGTSVTIYGTGFTSASMVKFQGSSVGVALPTNNNSNAITFTVPTALAPLCDTSSATGPTCSMGSMQYVTSGIYQVTVSTDGLVSNSVPFTVTSEVPPPPPIPVSNGSALTISLDPTIPLQTQSVTPGGTGYVFVAADLTAGPSADVTVNSINFGCGGFACSSSNNLKMVSGSETWTGSSANAALFTPNLYIPRGTTKVVELIGGVSANAPAGQQIEWSLTSNLVGMVNGGSISGSAFGNALTVSGSSNQPSATLSINGSGGPVTVSSGAQLSIVWSSTGIPNTCTVVFNPTGAGTYNIAEGLSGTTTVSAPSVSVQTAYQYEVACPVSGYGGASVSDTVQVNVTPGKTSNSPFTITAPAGGENLMHSSQYTIKWTSTGGPSVVNLNLLQNSSYLYQIASNVPNTGSYVWTVPSNYLGTGFAVYLSAVGYLPATSNSFSISQNSVPPAITVSADSTNPPSQAVAMGSTGDILGVFRFAQTTGGESVKTSDITIVDSVASTQTVLPSYSNVTLWSGATLIGTASAPVSDPTNKFWTYDFHLANPLVIPQGNSIVLTLKADIAPLSSGSATDQEYHIASVYGMTAVGSSSNLPASVTIQDASGPDLLIVDNALSVSSIPLGSVTGRGKTSVDALGALAFSVQGSGATAVNLISIYFGGSATANPNFLSGVDLKDSNNNSVILDGAVSSTPMGACDGVHVCSKQWSFGVPGFTLASSYNFTLTDNDNLTAVGNPAVLNAAIGNVQYFDNLSSLSGGAAGVILAQNATWAAPLGAQQITTISFAPGI